MHIFTSLSLQFMFLVEVLVQLHAYLMWQSYLIDKSRQAPIVRRAREIEVAK